MIDCEPNVDALQAFEATPARAGNMSERLPETDAGHASAASSNRRFVVSLDTRTLLASIPLAHHHDSQTAARDAVAATA